MTLVIAFHIAAVIMLGISTAFWETRGGPNIAVKIAMALVTVMGVMILTSDMIGLGLLS